MSDITPAGCASAVTSVSSSATASAQAPDWPDAARGQAFDAWLQGLAAPQGLRPESLCVASADASFRRYFRIHTQDGGSRIIMDAPPAQEDCTAFVRVAALMHEAGVHAPQVLAWDEAQGFMLLSDLGQKTLMQVLDAQRPEANLPHFSQALDALLKWQQASRAGVLPPYDEALLRRELALFADWYVGRHLGLTLSAPWQQTLAQSFDTIVAHNLAAPKVFVHRDFMPRNLMLGADDRLGVLDFQDAVYGPLSYDIASLMRDAFWSWDEEFVLDVTVRYWERARRAGLMDFEDWHSDFGSFWRAVEWMGLQRHLKVAGIFARLTLRDGKPKYLADAPRFIGYIRHTARRYRELTPLLKLMDHVHGTAPATGWSFGRV